jgi:hypothetical protein
MKPNNEILESVLGWSKGDLAGWTDEPIMVPIKAVYAAMDAVREEYSNPVPKELTPDDFERLGLLIDSIDSLACGLNIPMTAEFHIQQLKTILPKKVKELKESFVKITGENPWD